MNNETALFVTSSTGTAVQFTSINKCGLDDDGLLFFKLNWLDEELNDDDPSVYWQSFEQCPPAAAEVTLWTETASNYGATVGIENFGTPTLHEMQSTSNETAASKEPTINNVTNPTTFSHGLAGAISAPHNLT
tara:strand:+ start:134 stop:532 length:399 start_codon:yes stop_codon:yes gene_type:complete